MPTHDDPLALQTIIRHLRVKESRRDEGRIEGDRLALDPRVGPSCIVRPDEVGAENTSV